MWYKSLWFIFYAHLGYCLFDAPNKICMLDFNEIWNELRNFVQQIVYYSLLKSVYVKLKLPHIFSADFGYLMHEPRYISSISIKLGMSEEFCTKINSSHFFENGSVLFIASLHIFSLVYAFDAPCTMCMSDCDEI